MAWKHNAMRKEPKVLTMGELRRMLEELKRRKVKPHPFVGWVSYRLWKHWIKELNQGTVMKELEKEMSMEEKISFTRQEAARAQELLDRHKNIPHAEVFEKLQKIFELIKFYDVVITKLPAVASPEQPIRPAEDITERKEYSPPKIDSEDAVELDED